MSFSFAALWVALVVAANLPSQIITAEPFKFECKEGFHLIGTHCYLFIDVRQNRQDAKQFCKRYSSRLVRMKDSQESFSIAKIAKEEFNETREFWIRNKDNLECTGFWQPLEPKENPEHNTIASDMSGYWKIANPDDRMPFVCRTAACPEGFFKCGDGGKCIQRKWTCDGQYDCMDRSDENNCTSDCFYHLKGDTGLVDTMDTYPNNTICQWIIEGSPGDVLKLEFQVLDLEPDVDVLTVYVGGPTLDLSTKLEEITGNENNKVIYSNNNFFILRLRSDGTVSNAGIKATWSLVPELKLGEVTTLHADATYQMFTTPFFDETNVPLFMMHEWLITAPKGELITLEVMNTTFEEKSIIISEKGVTFDITEEDRMIVVSQTNQLTVLIQGTNEENLRFEARFRSGCNIEASFSHASLTIEEMPADLNCIWNISNSEDLSFTALFMEPEFDDYDDFLNVFSGEMNENNKSLHLNFNSSEQGVVDIGNRMIIQYYSNSLRPGNEINAIIASDCPDFPNSQHMFMEGSKAGGISYSVNITCENGYAFRNEEYYRDGVVEASCSPFGKWDFGSTSYTRYPYCQIVYCGIPKQIDNGLIRGSGGNVTFGGIAQYDCFNGFTLNGDQTITCQANGTWTEPPSCEAKPCDSVPDVMNSNHSFVTGDDELSFGTIVRYTCEEGYELFGARQIVCGVNGTWSHDAPLCQRKTCELPDIVRGTLETMSMYTSIYYEDTFPFTCDEGFFLSGTELTTNIDVECGPERKMLNDTLHCVDIDECLQTPCERFEVCINNHGSYKCLCESGYSGDPCTKTNDPYAHCLLCSPTSETYCCSCDEGYELFTEDGLNGFHIPKPEENGLRDYDVLHLNFTCVPKQCETPGMDVAGTPFLVSAKSSHHYKDELVYYCGFGYLVAGTNDTAFCNSSGDFEAYGMPSCSALKCLAPEKGNELEESRSSTASHFDPEETLDITCFKGDGTNNTVVKRLFCAPTPNVANEFSMQGDNPTCQKIDCGPPIMMPGANFTVTSTNFNDSFEFSCDVTGGYYVSGYSSESTRTVTCLGNGRWDFENLTCAGVQCSDPGFHAGTQYDAPNGFVVDAVVTYRCEDISFTLDPPYPRICQFNGQTSWNGTIPTCSDQIPPTLECPNEVEYNLYDILIMPTITSTDNSNYAVVTQTFGPLPGTLVTTDTYLEFTATDGNLQNVCRVEIKVKELTPPTLECVQAHIVINQGQTVTVDDIVTSFSPNTSDLVISPDEPIDQAPGSVVGRWVSVTNDGLQKQCGVIVEVAYPPCSNESIINPTNGVITNCYESGSSYMCDIQCNDGYVLPSLNSSYTGQCSEGIWTPSPSFFNCFATQSPILSVDIVEVFGINGNFYTPTPISKQACFDSHENKLTAFVNNLSGVCDAATFSMLNVLVNEKTPSQVTAEMIIEIRGISKSSIAACVNTLVDSKILDPNDEPGPDCRTPWTIINDEKRKGTPIPSECDGNSVIHTLDNGELECVPCAPGYQFDGASCVRCGFGYYNPTPGQTSCQECPYNGGIMLISGSNFITADDCEEICPPGFMSPTGYAADNCTACPVDTYWQNAQLCEPCPNNGSTGEVEGAIDFSFCFDPCPVGSYSLTGYENCSLCPQHYFSEEMASNRCIECSSNKYTDSQGSNSAADCKDGSTLCTDELCNAQGTSNCSVIEHEARCLCNPGYSGNRCEVYHNPCDAHFCYNEATCVPDGVSYSCNCLAEQNCTFESNNTIKYTPDAAGLGFWPGLSRAQCEEKCVELRDSCVAYIDFGTLCFTMTTIEIESPNNYNASTKSCVKTPLFAGEYCEEDLTDDCTVDSCSNIQFCKDKVNDTECVCPPGGAYQDSTCEPSSNPCNDSKCQNGAKCKHYESVRRICICEPGYTGEDCSVPIDECTINPDGCLYDGECQDGVNSYSCDCKPGFGGDHCEMRGNLCEDFCGPGGECMTDYHTMEAICFCGDDYQWKNESTRDTCVPIKYCDSSPCKNNATCTDSIGGFHCNCPSGYEGTLCQLSIDDCEVSPCKNEGVCHDLLNDFQCDCPPGYAGKTCNTDTVNCFHHCDITNLAFCENLGLDYTCNCNDGFKGKNCSEQIRLCDNEPCQHNGSCTNLFNDFKCVCADGWTGTTCEEIQDYCDELKPCQNEATCHNLMDGTYCNCGHGTAGTYCETKADVCAIFGSFACLHGECSDDKGPPTCECLGAKTTCEMIETEDIEYSGEEEDILKAYTSFTLENCEQDCMTNDSCTAYLYYANFDLCQLRTKYILDEESTLQGSQQKIKKCQYDPYYTGKSCNLEKDHCSNITCGEGENEGKCILDGLSYKCDCEEVKNFGGPQCTTPVNVCQPGTCPESTSCHEYMDEDGYLRHVCLCEADKVLSGNVCKGVERDFDLAFPVGIPNNNFVTSLRGFYMGSDENAMTLGFWFICAGNPGDWVLAIANADQDPESSEFDPFIKISNEHIIFTETVNISLPHNIDADNEWHYISFSIYHSGLYRLSFDYTTYQKIESGSPRISVSFPREEYFVVHLGQKFSGYISQVSVWNAPLSQTAGLAGAFDKLHVSKKLRLVLGWTLYSENVLVHRVYPSSASQKLSICDIVDTLANADICPGNYYADKDPPTLLNSTPCLKKKIFVVDEHEHQMTVNDLKYNYPEGTTGSNIEGGVYSYGAHDVAFTSTDPNGNTAVCMTRVYVTANDCEDSHTRPSDKFEYCDEANNSVIIECPEGQYPSTPVPRVMTCSMLGSYNLEDMFRKPARVVCGGCGPITYSVTLKIVYSLGTQCPPASIDTLSNKVHALMVTLRNEKWNSLCIDDACSNIVVNAECSSPSSRMANVTIEIYQLPPSLNSSDSLQFPLTPRELMLKIVEDKVALDAEATFFAQLEEDNFSVEEQPKCSPGHVIRDDCCVQCGEGSYHDVEEDKCILCPLNYYSNSSNQIECTQCPGGRTTLQEGTNSIADCTENCEPGNYLNITSGTCQKCHSNFYQDESGQIACKPCPPATGTEAEGSSSEDECRSYCEPGTQLNGEDCVECIRGFYRRGEIQDQCKPCPENSTTRNEGASSMDECNIPICDPGSFVQGVGFDLYECETCDYGTYQNETSQFLCMPCARMYTTEEKGSINETQCKFLCPPGKEEDTDNPGSCISCPRDKYRGPSLDQRFLSCQNCTAGKITVKVGSQFLNECVIADCSPGYYLNSSQNLCFECDYGTYQPEKWQLECLKCDDNFTTENMSSTQEKDCRFTCPEGEEEFPLNSENCHKCPRGTFRNSSLSQRFLPCENCSEGWTTVGEGATQSMDCTITVCVAGEYHNVTDNICIPCPKGEFQNQTLQESCIPCHNHHTTNGTGKTSEDSCIFICPEGHEVSSPGMCTPCERGYYKNSTMEFDLCEPCAANWTTDNDTSTSFEQCHIKLCSLGEILSNDNMSCVACDIDTYQPMDEPYSYTTCSKCLENKGTDDIGRSSDSDCKTFCQPGFGFNSSIDDCTICPRGFFNSANFTTRFIECQMCPENYTTHVLEGATDVANCSLRDCPAGSFFNSIGDCVLCPLGQYQPDRRTLKCIDCPSNTNTSREGQVSNTSCTIFCPAGQEDNSTGNCFPCQPDYFKEISSFGGCSQCTDDLTSGQSRTSCSEMYCDFGRELNGSAQCQDCAKGTFKMMRGNESCQPCPLNTTTSSTGAYAELMCSVAYCVPGYYSLDDINCQACEIGYYKQYSGNHNCVACAENRTTDGEASINESACYLLVCPEGEYRNESNICSKCPIGLYQPNKGNTSCLPCNRGYTTDETGSTLESDCKIECSAGFKRNLANDKCLPCDIGFYQSLPNADSCASCPDNFTTNAEESSSESECFILCPVGYKKVSSIQCEPCERGQFQNAQNKEMCNTCSDISGYEATTIDVASTSINDCLPLCPQGLYLNITERDCKSCSIGTFKSTVGLDTSCENCPEGNTTLTRESKNRQACRYELCNAGYFRQEGKPDCQKCPFGEFQPLSGVMVTSCTPCASGKTTLIEGAMDGNEDCVTDCPNGQEYNVATQSCEECGIGLYRKKPSLNCVFCPTGTTTLGSGFSDCVDSPNATPRTPTISTYKMNVTFAIQNCGNENHIINVLSFMIKRMLKFRRIRFNAVCTNANCDNIVIFVPLFCGTRRSRRFAKRATSGTAIAEITASDVPDILDDGNNTFPATTVLQDTFNDISPIADTLTTNGIAVQSVGAANVACNPGSVLGANNMCEMCAGGQYHDKSYDVCSPCLKGTYSTANRIICDSCTDGLTTRTTGSVNETYCDGVCAFSNNLCGANGNCQKNSMAVSYCQCDDGYSGETCQSRIIEDPDDGDDIFLVAGISAGAGVLLLLILLFVFIGVKMRSHSKTSKKKSVSSEGDSRDYKVPVYFAPTAVSGSQQPHLMAFDPTMYQSDVIDMQQQQLRDQNYFS